MLNFIDEGNVCYMKEKRLCPFRKTTITKVCSDQYTKQKEVFQTCLGEKCMLYNFCNSKSTQIDVTTLTKLP